MLAFYLSDIDENEQHAFVVPQDVNAVFIEEGYWEHFSQHPQRRAQLEENEVSYVWDALIEQFNGHIIARTQYYTSHDSVRVSEKIVRLLASGLLEVVADELPEWGRCSRHLLPSRPGDTCYVFLTLWHPSSVSYEEFREVRRKLLEAYCMVLKTLYPEAEDIVGRDPATNPRPPQRPRPLPGPAAKDREVLAWSRPPPARRAAHTLARMTIRRRRTLPTRESSASARTRGAAP